MTETIGNNWKENKEVLNKALEKVLEIEQLLGENFSLTSLGHFKNDLTMNENFYNFLLVSKKIIANANIFIDNANADIFFRSWIFFGTAS
jgi:hypothetical protein